MDQEKLAKALGSDKPIKIFNKKMGGPFAWLHQLYLYLKKIKQKDK